MRIQGEGQLLRVFVGEGDRWQGRPLHEAIVQAAREQGLAGATVLRGLEGFGANSLIHTVKVLRLSEDLPIVIEIVDLPERIGRFLPTLDKMVTEGLVTLEKVNVLIYRHSAAALPAEEEVTPDVHEYRHPVDPEVLFAHATERVQRVIAQAKAEAGQSRHVFIDSVHILLALLAESRELIDSLFAELGIDVDAVESNLRAELTREPPSDEFLDALDERSRGEAQWLGQQIVDIEQLLLALCETRPSAATDILMRLGVQPRDVCRNLLSRLAHADDWQRWLADHPDM
jgi:hypothetical protein